MTTEIQRQQYRNDQHRLAAAANRARHDANHQHAESQVGRAPIVPIDRWKWVGLLDELALAARRGDLPARVRDTALTIADAVAHRMNRPPIIRRHDGHVLVDRASLARLTGRSITIRAACPIADPSWAGRRPPCRTWRRISAYRSTVPRHRRDFGEAAGQPRAACRHRDPTLRPN